MRTATPLKNSAGSLLQAATDVAAALGGNIALKQTMKPMKAVFPAAGVTDTGIVAGNPTTTGLRFIAWNDATAPWNLQSQNWTAVPTGSGQNTSGTSCCRNASTPRIWTYGNMTNEPIESNIDFGFVTDSVKVIPVWNHNTQYTGSNYQDNQMYVEDGGDLKKITANPTTSTASGTLFYRSLTYGDSHMREHRFMLPAQCWFAGVWIDANAVIRKSPNKFLLITNGDSWNEPGGNVIASPAGGSWPTGTYRTAGLSQMIAEATGWAVALCAEGGTGEFNCNDGQSRAASYADSALASVFHGTTRINDMWTKFGARNPVVMTIGGWNDGTLGGTPYTNTYQTRVRDGIDRFIAKKTDVKLIYLGIQPVDLTDGDARNLSMLGQAAACAERSANATFISMKPMWTIAGQRTAAVNNTDNIHLHIKGANGVGDWIVSAIANLTIPATYYQAMLAA